MPRPATPHATRVTRTVPRAAEIVATIESARNARSFADERAAWAKVAELAGNVQRDARQLAGLGG